MWLSLFSGERWAVTVHFASKSMLDGEEANRDFHHRKFVRTTRSQKQDLQANSLSGIPECAVLHRPLRVAASMTSKMPSVLSPSSRAPTSTVRLPIFQEVHTPSGTPSRSPRKPWAGHTRNRFHVDSAITRDARFHLL
jgi:hypothetical protein